MAEEKKEYTNHYSFQNVKFWNKGETVLGITISAQSDENNNYYPRADFSISNLTPENKFVRIEGEEGKERVDAGVFGLNIDELIKFSYALEKLIPDLNSIDDDALEAAIWLGCKFNHISAVTNSGSQMELVQTTEGPELSIFVVENKKIVKEYHHVFRNNSNIEYYDADGSEKKLAINLDIYKLKYMVKSLPAITGLGKTCFDLYYSRNNANRSGGTIDKSTSKVASTPSRRVIPPRANTDSETPNSVGKKAVGRKSINKSGLQKLIDEDEE